MNTAIIACKTISDELRHAMAQTGTDYPVVWLEQGLHNVPELLRSALQTALDGLEAQRVLLAMGFCGNAIRGVEVPACELIIPRVDDCISLLLGSVQRRLAVSREHAAYFFTEGWLRGERNIWVEYQHMVSKYGEDVARDIAGTMFGNYRTLMLLDSGTEPIEQLVESTEIVAETLHLEQKVAPATRDYLAELLRGPWDDERFVVVSPGSIITAKDLMLTRTECQR